MLGIDVSKAQLSCALVDPSTLITKWERTVPNSPAGIAELQASTPAGTPWVVEPTGRYSLTVACEARQYDQPVLLAPARQAKAFLRSLTSRAKTDRLDARGLALFALSRPLQPYPMKSHSVDQLDQLLSARKKLSLSLSSLTQTANELPLASDLLAPSIRTLKAELKTLDKQIATLVESNTDFKAAAEIQKVSGIGKVTAAAVTARLSARSFPHPDQFVAYIGLDVGVFQSGKRKGERGLTKQGDAELRRLLYLCAQANLRCKISPFKAQYERELAKGLSRTAALNAVARKLAKVCWALHARGGAYDPARVYVRPNRRSAEHVESTESGGG